MKRLKQLFQKSKRSSHVTVESHDDHDIYQSIPDPDCPNYTVKREENGAYSFSSNRTRTSADTDADDDTSAKSLVQSVCRKPITRRATEGDILNVERQESKSQEVTANDWTERNLYFNMPTTEETQPKVDDGNTHRQQTDEEDQSGNVVCDESDDRYYNGVPGHISQSPYTTVGDNFSPPVYRALFLEDDEGHQNLAEVDNTADYKHNYTEGGRAFQIRNTSCKRNAQSASVMPVATSSLTRSGNCSSNINLIATDDLDYIRLTAVAMTKLQNRSTASVAVDILTLISSKPEEIDEEQQRYRDRGFRVEQDIACAVYSHLGNVRAEVSSIWMDNSVIKGRTSFEMSTYALCKGLMWKVPFRVESSNSFNKNVGLDSNFQCEICIRQEGGIEYPIIVLSDLHESTTAAVTDSRCKLPHCSCECGDTLREVCPSTAQLPTATNFPVAESREKKQLNMKHNDASADSNDKCYVMSERHHVDNVCCNSDVSPVAAAAEPVGDSLKQLCPICYKKKIGEKHKLEQKIKHLPSSTV